MVTPVCIMNGRSQRGLDFFKMEPTTNNFKKKLQMQMLKMRVLYFLELGAMEKWNIQTHQ